jgi:hypothetical protein
MIDLHQGVLELFAEAQYLARPRRLHHRVLSYEEQRRLVRSFRPRERNRIKGRWRRRIASELRMERPRYVIEPLPRSDHVHHGSTQTRTCSRCGAIEELRPGLDRWQHMTKYGRCVMLEKKT